MSWWFGSRGWGGWRGKGWSGPWPGNGPFSYLPPWERPGWVFGRGSCWWLYGYPWMMRYYQPYPWWGFRSYWYPYSYYYSPMIPPYY